MTATATSATSTPTTIVWFRQDLRLLDNPALLEACEREQVLPLYIHDTSNAGDWGLGGASRWWLHHSLAELDKCLQGKLWLLAGDPLEIIPRLMREQGARHICWNRCYEPWQIQRDKKLELELQNEGLTVSSHNGSQLWEPWENLKGDGTAYRVFTPYYRNAIAHLPPISHVKPAPQQIDLAICEQGPEKLDKLALLPDIEWYTTLGEHWQPGEAGAQERLQKFLSSGLHNYKKGRDFPNLQAVSRLSPHLHFGEISPRQLWHAAGQQRFDDGHEDQSEHFQRELAWREFSVALLYHFPELTQSNMNAQFDAFPWRRDEQLLRSWQKGETGFPLVDAGMRELWQTGYMHNRVRMVVGSFLVKNLRHHWLDGARWFWDCLLDADLANNTCSWQWVAGCGADAAPYFRIFNPITQSQKFDPTAEYIRRYVPELKRLPDKLIHDPASAPQQELEAAGIKLGRDYPEPIVELKASRQAALDAYQQIRLTAELSGKPE